MKIGLVLDDSLDPPDGVQQYVLTLGAWLTRQGHTVHYLVGQTTRTDIAGVHSLSRNIAVSFNGNRMRIPLPTSRRSLKTLLDTERYDVLHIQMPYSPMLAHRLILAAGPETVVVGTFHIVAYSKLVSWANHALGFWLRRSLKRFDAVMAVSKPASELARSAYHIESRVIPNLVDISHFKKATPQKSASTTVAYLGRLVERKGCRTLLEAVALLQADATVPSFRTIIGGKGELKAELENVARTKQLQGITFAGFISEDDKPNFLASADICVFPSKGGESFGIILVEAMASGRSAVLGGDNSGYHTVLAGTPEALFDPLQPAALAETMRTMLRDAVARQDLADRQAIAASQFDQEILGPRVVGIYQEGLRARQPTGIMKTS